MNTIRYFSLLVITHLLVATVHAGFSFNEMTSWILGHKQETVQREFTCNKECTLVIENLTGSIHIKTWTLPKVVIQAKKTAREKELELIDFEAFEKQNTITVKTKYDDKKIKGTIDYYIMVPPQINLKVATKNGTVKVKNVQGIIEIKVETGSIEVLEAQNNLFLKNKYGPITATIKEMQPTTHLILEAYSAITLSLPTETEADIHAKTNSGVITSDHYLTLKPLTAKLNQQTWSNIKKEINARLGDGGSQINLLSTTGNIRILEY